MRIEDLRSESIADRTRIAATVIWEDTDRPKQEVYFEAEERYADSVSCTPHPFLLGCIVPALHHGEERILIDGEICSDLREGLDVAMRWLHLWYYRPDSRIVRIEAGTGSGVPDPRKTERAACFISGGIDSLALLRANRLNYSREHPGSFKDGLIIYGQNVESDLRPKTFSRAVAALSELGRESGLELIPVYTNIRYLDTDGRLFKAQSHSAILAAVAHIFERRLTRVSVASSDDIPGLSLLRRHNLEPHGSHPLIEPNYSSSTLQVRHDGLALSRLDKTRLVAGWDAALQNIRVCGPNWPGENCGQCEKCIRTMLALLALGVLHKTRSFPVNDVTEQMVAGIRIRKPEGEDSYSTTHNYMELVPLLRDRGRGDLVRAIEKLLGRYHNGASDIRTAIRRFDQKYLHGSLARLRQSLVS